MIETETVSTDASFHKLLSPLTVRGQRLANRAVMGAMHTRIETLDRPAERLRAFYRARAEGEIGLILTGGISPNREGRLEDDAPVLDETAETWSHEAILSAVEGTQTRVCMQILHAGRYAKHADCVGPSAIRARINRFTPKELSTGEVWKTVSDYARTASFARDLGYHGVEIMGSEGYLINQFTAGRTNTRADEFGGDFDARMRFPVEVVRAVRQAVGDGFLVIYRISALDLVEGGMTGEETAELARRIGGAGADILNTGIGWHESSVPTVAHVVPRAAWVFATERLKRAVSLPVIASNRINDLDVAEKLLQDGSADLVSMARPLLADPAIMRKARAGRPDTVNTCIACNQACLDRIFVHESTSCLVNPEAGHEIEFPYEPTTSPKRLAVVGGGAAGMAFSIAAARRGHSVTLFEAADRLGGQLLMARAIPLKSEFGEMLRYFKVQLGEQGVDVRLNTPAEAAMLASGGFDEVILATGVKPRKVDLPRHGGPEVLDYPDVLLRGRPVGRRVVIIGAGGIGFDTAEYLLDEPYAEPELDEFLREYGIDRSIQVGGGLVSEVAAIPPKREVTLLQRTSGKVGARLAISTGWIRKSKLTRSGVQMISGVTYQRIDAEGVHVVIDGQPRVLAADTVVICAGQESERGLYEELAGTSPDVPLHLIGGADYAAELDAMRAINQAMRLAQVV